MRFRVGGSRSVLGIIAFLISLPAVGPGLSSSIGEPAFGAVAGRPLSTSPAVASSDKSQPDAAGLPLSFARHTDDLDAMVNRRNIRALVFYSRSGRSDQEGPA